MVRLKVFKKIFPNLSYIATLDTGIGWGEIALKSKNSLRTASIIANGDCEFLTLNKDDHHDILKEYDRFVNKSRIRFLQEYPVFS